MALSDEQNAMLRLLARGEQGYADIAALLGLGEEEVRAKVVGALAQLEAEGKPVPDVPPPLAGREKQATKEPAQVPPQPAAGPPEDPAGPAVAGSVPPPVAPQPPGAAPAPGTPPAGRRTITLPTGRSAWLLGGGAAAVIAAIIVVIVLVSGGDSPTGSAEGAPDANTGGGSTATTAAKRPTEAKLTAVDGSGATGRATFGRVKNKLALQVEATGLEPTVEGTNSYTVWLAASPRKMVPLAATGVRASGRGAGEIAAQFEVPVEVLAYLANGTFDQIAITRTDNKRLEAAVKVAKQKKRGTLTYTGDAVLRGKITGPIVGLAIREKEAKRGERGK